jgi:hypothetical protein
MAKRPDTRSRLTASRVCALTGVRPQTRETWARRGLLRTADRYGEFDVIEQTIVKALLGTLPKSQVDHVWQEARPQLRELLVGTQLSLVWDPELLTVTVTKTESELCAAVRHGRSVHVVALDELIAKARRLYRAEIRSQEQIAAAREETSGSRGGRRPRSLTASHADRP